MRFAPCLVALAASLVARSSLAEPPSLALDRLSPAPVGDPTLAVESAHVGQGGGVGVLGSYARSPLTVRVGEDKVRVVSSQWVAHAQASLRLGGRLGLDVQAPVVVAQSGRALSGGGLDFAEPKGGKLGDVRLGARFLLSHPEDRAGVALSLRGWLPTGQGADYAGAGGARFAPALVFGWSGDHLVGALSVGRTFRSSAHATPRVAGSETTAGAAVAYRDGRTQLGVEAFGATVADSRTAALGRQTTAAEALVVGRVSFGALTLIAAAGPGIGHGVGTPSYRAVLGVSFSSLSSPDPAPRDTVVIGPPGASVGASSGPRGAAPGRSDREREAEAGVDTDGDGVLDEVDACPRVIGPPQADPKRSGCPLDSDGDGIVDAEDACKTIPGPASDDRARNGCPGDKDGDGVTDDVDACPELRGERSSDPAQNGCPKLLTVGDKQIDIRQQVLFETGRDVIRKESFPLLQEISTTLNDVPTIVRVAVDGHTDDVGLTEANLALSRRRALAVMRWLIDHGVDARRLEARGFGPRRPIADNKTPEGREKNRRVEFIIQKRSPRGAADWVDGPVE